jgi:hypothetical protein
MQASSWTYLLTLEGATKEGAIKSRAESMRLESSFGESAAVHGGGPCLFSGIALCTFESL